MKEQDFKTLTFHCAQVPWIPKNARASAVYCIVDKHPWFLPPIFIKNNQMYKIPAHGLANIIQNIYK